MRHLNQYTVTASDNSNSSNTDIKMDVNMSDLKVEMPYLTLLSDCDTLIKSEFSSDEELGFNFNTDSEQFELSKKQSETRKNKRKALTPQRAAQNDFVQKNVTEHSLGTISDMMDNSNCPEDNIFSQIYLGNDLIFSDSELPESEDLLRDIDEENIFKGIQEEAGEPFILYISCRV